jgi:hypothetical protein
MFRNGSRTCAILILTRPKLVINKERIVLNVSAPLVAAEAQQNVALKI